MFDIGWTEMLVIAVVMIVVVGPKDLPRMLRTFGKMTTKVRGMAGDFQKQFNEALKEAELDDVKKSVDALRSLNPAAEIKKQLNPFEKAAADVRAGLDNAMKPKLSTSSEPAASVAHEAEPLKNGAADMSNVTGPDAMPATPPPGLMTSGITPAGLTPVGPAVAAATPAPIPASSPKTADRKPRAAAKPAAAKASAPAETPASTMAVVKPRAAPAPVAVAKPAATPAVRKTAAPRAAAAATPVAPKRAPRKST